MFAPRILLLTALAAAPHARATDPGATWRPPPAPEPIRQLLKEADVSFEFYGEGEGDRQYPGLTTFDASYSYRARHSFRVAGSGADRQLLVQPRISSLRFTRSHTIRLPRSLQGPDFFTNRLVLHELDHVRISNDPRWEQLFRSRVREIDLLAAPLPPGTNAIKRVAEQVIRDAIEKAFREVQQLVEIRYQELDRVTQHGLRPLPEEYWKEFAGDPAAAPEISASGSTASRAGDRSGAAK